MLNKNVILIILPIIFFQCSYAQSKNEFKDFHGIHLFGNLETGLIIGGGSLNVDIRFIHREKFQMFSRVGYGGFTSLSAEGERILVSLPLLFGHYSKGNFFEVNLGWFIDHVRPQGTPYNFSDPLFSLGYRKHSKKSRFLFRTGAGYPEFIYLSLGLALGKSSTSSARQSGQ